MIKKALNIELSSTPNKPTKIIFKIIHFLFSLNFGFVKNRWATTLYVLIFLANTFSLTFYMYFSSNKDWSFIEIWFNYGMYIAYYVVLVLILLFNGKKLTFYEYLCRLQTLDSVLFSRTENLPNFWVKLCTTSAFCVAIRTAMNFIFCTLYGEQCLPSFLISMYGIQIFTLAYDIVALVNCSIFHLAYFRLEKFVDLVKEAKKTSQRINLKYHLLYKELVDLTDEIKTAFDPLFAVNLLFTFAIIMDTSYMTVASIKEDNMPIVSTFVFVQTICVIQSTILVLTPTIFAGMLSYKAKELKLELRSQLLLERDQAQVDNLGKLLKYVEARDFNFHVYGVIPLQPQLFMTVLNVCVGYLIIIIQLTHLG